MNFHAIYYCVIDLIWNAFFKPWYLRTLFAGMAAIDITTTMVTLFYRLFSGTVPCIHTRLFYTPSLDTDFFLPIFIYRHFYTDFFYTVQNIIPHTKDDPRLYFTWEVFAEIPGKDTVGKTQKNIAAKARTRIIIHSWDIFAAIYYKIWCRPSWTGIHGNVGGGLWKPQI